MTYHYEPVGDERWPRQVYEDWTPLSGLFPPIRRPDFPVVLLENASDVAIFDYFTDQTSLPDPSGRTDPRWRGYLSSHWAYTFNWPVNAGRDILIVVDFTDIADWDTDYFRVDGTDIIGKGIGGLFLTGRQWGLPDSIYTWEPGAGIAPGLSFEPGEAVVYGRIGAGEGLAQEAVIPLRVSDDIDPTLGAVATLHLDTVVGPLETPPMPHIYFPGALEPPPYPYTDPNIDAGLGPMGVTLISAL